MDWRTAIHNVAGLVKGQAGDQDAFSAPALRLSPATPAPLAGALDMSAAATDAFWHQFHHPV
jgi:hypothetical protein